jgi:Zn-dependent protease
VILSEPNRTPYDLNFALFGVPVRVDPFFWLVTVLMSNSQQPILIVLWVLAVFVSILVHEFGHVFAMRRYGQRCHVVLHSFGGLAIPDSQIRRSTSAQVFISLAGPVAGFMLWGLLAGVAWATGNLMIVTPPGSWFPVMLTTYFSGVQGAPFDVLMFDLLQINLFWGLINLLPVFPLDGGQVLRAALTHTRRDGFRESLMVSIAVAAVIALLAWTRFDERMLALLFAYLAYTNLMTLQALNHNRGGY